MTTKDKEFEVAQVAQFLGELYNQQKDLSSAIEWYRIALQGYKDLGQQEYISTVEEILESLYSNPQWDERK